MDRDLDLSLAASFVAIVDNWSFSRAADELHVSRPTLTRQIQRLEQQLGVRLLERGPEGLTGLTPAGLDFTRRVRPLLRQARVVRRQAARAELPGARGPVRLGVPAGSTSFLRFLDVELTCAQVRTSFPALRVCVVEIPFALLGGCLVEDSVDVLLTVAPVEQAGVTSAALPLTASRIGVLSQRHALAGVGSVDVGLFGRYGLLWNPTLPAEWMRPFWLGDLRTEADAELIATHCSSNERVLHETQRGTGAIVTLSPDRAVLPHGLQAVTLVDAPPVRFHAARRQGEQRPAVVALMARLGGHAERHLP